VRSQNIFPIQADLRRPDDCRKVVAGAQYVFFFAGILSTSVRLNKDPLEHVNDTLVLNIRLLEAAWLAGVEQCVLLSSTTGYPVLDRPLTEEDMFTGKPHPTYGFVGTSVRQIEALARAYFESLPRAMSLAVLRPSTIYSEHGDFNPATCHVFPAMVRKVADRRDPIDVIGDGQARRDLIHGGDVLRACLQSLRLPKGYHTFNICSGQQHSINDMLRALLEVDGWPNARIVHHPVNYLASSTQSLDGRLAREVLKFTPSMGLREGAKVMLDSYKQLRGCPGESKSC
jgi:nucleoside-diphosphate-sugar epimerase